MASGFRYEGPLIPNREAPYVRETPVLIGMSGSLRSGSYSNAVLETLREKFSGRAEICIYDLATIPLYNQDFEGEKRPRAGQGAAFGDRRERWARAVRPGVQPQHSRRPEKRDRLGLAPGLHLGDGVQAGGDHGDLARGPRAAHAASSTCAWRSDSMLSRVALAREVIITSSADKIRDGRLVDETWLGFACGAVEALLHEIEVWRAAAG